jgi:hypothetical protein
MEVIRLNKRDKVGAQNDRISKTLEQDRYNRQMIAVFAVESARASIQPSPGTTSNFL